MQRIALILTGALLAIGAQAAGPGGENAIDLSAYATKDAVTALQSRIPSFATVMPKAEAGASNLGTVPQIPYADHQHPRLTATAKGTLDGTGNATVVFTQVFDAEPAVTVISVGAKSAGWAVPDFDVTFVTSAQGKFTGCTVYGRRARRLPPQPLAASPLALTTLLTGVITGVNAIAASITGYDATEDAAGAGFSLIAVKAS
ncbi:hypothetical protein [Methylobacterium gossipiicola]|uniref:Uncharacterized protein n=1 Tax=Methylobacterium gossipiicola TaxID=582675 RepID=A0A1I2WSL5_9HYPH|nr:hypothetical protein [Methylobacterium gossipiicola]SFH04333.1 hypothetical protein SAMN05192565_1273 [Methylobacterium gossipiicola]